MDTLSVEEAALVYLDKTDALKNFKEKCYIYENNKQNRAAYNFVLIVDPIELAEINAELGNLVICRISAAAKIFQEVCFTTIQSLHLLSAVEYISQVLVHLRVSNIPDLPSFTLNPADLWSCRADTRLYKFLGIICSISTVTQYTQAARYYCTVTTCDGYTGQHFIRMHTPGASEFQTIRNDFVCIFCGSTLVEDASCRLLSDKIIVQMLSYDALNSNGCRHQAISVFLRGDLTSDIMIGKSYRVIGIPTYQHNESKISVAIEANNIYMDSKKLEQICNQGNCSITMPSSVLTLYDDRKSSSWSFVASLAYIFGGDITPPGTYFRLKLGMLLSLVETPKNNKQKSKVSRCLHVLAIGCDTLVIHRLLTFGASFCKRNIQHSASTSLFTSVTKDNHGTGACTIDGGSLLLAKNGICSLGDLSHYRKDTREKLLHVMENSSISVDIPRKFSDAAPQKQMVLPILCNIWAYTYPSTGNHKGIKGIFQNQDLGNIPNTFADTFGMVYVCDNPDTTRDDTAQQTLINQVLTAAVLDDKQQHTVQSIITYEDFKKFLDYVSEMHVEFTSSAEYLIKGYFVGSRRVRSSGVHATPFPQSAMKAIACMASAHAKLSLRREVVEEDAVLAIMLYEESVTARYGYSVLSVQPTPHFQQDNLPLYVGKQNDLKMQQFQVQLTRFCLSHASELSSRFTEE